jgi:hypothetical protein
LPSAATSQNWRGGGKTSLIVRKGKSSEYEKLNFQAIRTCTFKLSLRVTKQTSSQKLISVYISDTKFRGLKICTKTAAKHEGVGEQLQHCTDDLKQS